MKQSISVIILMAMAGIAMAQINFEHEEWSKVRHQAKKEGKIVFVDAYTTWCGPCKWMSKNVFTDPTVGEFYNKNFINLKLDMEKGEGLVFAEQYEVNAYPTLLFVDGDGELLHKHLGAIPADQLVAVGRDALSPQKRLSTLMKMYEEKKHDKAFLHDYIVKMLNAGINVSEAADDYFALLDNNEFVTEDNFTILQMWRPSSKSKAFDLLYKRRKGFISMTGEESVYGLMESILVSDLQNAIYRDDTEAFHRVQAKTQSLDVPFKDKVLTLGNMLYAESQKNMDGYLRHAAEYGKKFHWNEWNTLNNLAWDMYLNEELQSRKQMKLALKFAKRAVKLEPNYYTTDTYAATLYKVGKYDKALQWAETAVDIARKAGEDTSITEELIEKIYAAMEGQGK